MNKNDLVYICSPLSAPTKEGIQKNMERAAHYARLVSGTFGCRAIAPHSFLPIRMAGELNIPAYALIEYEGRIALAEIIQEERTDEVQICKRNIP